jgi:hypothetical protein
VASFAAKGEVDVTEWEPATDAEVAMRNALRTDDQESYFRILAGVDLLLPVSADALAGLAPLGWGTWSTGGRTHVLAFTSPAALQACLADYTGSARRVAYTELADTWPNLEWWLAVNPGLPIEGYLPAWFVAQLSRGDLRLPTRGPGREGSNAPERIQDLHAAATLAANAAAQGYSAAGQPGGPMTDRPMSGAPVSGVRSSGTPMSEGPAGGSAYGGQQPGGQQSGAQAYGAQASGGQQSGGQAYGAQASGGQQSGGQAYGAQASGGQQSGGQAYGAQGPGGQQSGGQAYGAQGPGGQQSGGQAYGAQASGGQQGYGAQASGGQQAGAPAYGSPYGSPPSGGAPPPYGGATPGVHPSARPVPGSPAAEAAGASTGPGGLPLRTPGGVLPSGLPSRVPGTPQGPGGRGNGIPGGQFNGFGLADRAPGASPGGFTGEPAPPWPGGEAGASGPSVEVPAAYAPPAPPAAPAGGTVGAAARPHLPSALDALATRTGAASGGPSALDALGSRSGMGTSSRGTSGEPAAPAPQRPDSPLPTRTPMAQTPPLPAHIPPPSDAEVVSPATADETAPPRQDDEPGRDAPEGVSPGQVTPPRSAAAQAPAGVRAPAGDQSSPAAQSPTVAPRAGLAPPVIPGAAGAGRSTGPGSAVPAAAVRHTIPPPAGTQPPARPIPEEDDFVPANEVERDLIRAVDGGSTDSFLSTLLLATVLVPVAPNSRPGSAPGESGFAFRTEETDGERFLVVFTSRDRLGEHFTEPARTVAVRFVDLIRNWPDPAWSFAVNPTSVIGARYPGPQVIALASWAVEAGLGGDPADAPAAVAQRPTEPSAPLTMMQKAVPAEQVDYYLERGYDRVAGFVHRAGEVEHLKSPGELFAALGLVYDGSPYQPDAKEAYVLRWPAHRPSLYRIPYGGQSEQALRAMDGWVIERAPFRGNGFAPGEGKDVIAEFKVDSVRLPHGAELWRMDADGDTQLVATFDCDAPVWRRVGEQ